MGDADPQPRLRAVDCDRPAWGQAPAPERFAGARRPSRGPPQQQDHSVPNSSEGDRRGRRAGSPSDSSRGRKKPGSLRRSRSGGGSDSGFGDGVDGEVKADKPSERPGKPVKRRPKTRSDSTESSKRGSKSATGRSGEAHGERGPKKRPKRSGKKASKTTGRRGGESKRRSEPRDHQTRHRDPIERPTRPYEGDTSDNQEVAFDELPLAASVADAVADAGYTVATPIQSAAIPPAVMGYDVLGSAQTGTGKTAAFALPILTRIADNPGKAIANQPRVLVLAPTRELAAQILESFETYGQGLQLRNTVIFGGVGQGKQTAALKRGVHILVATPGRLLDLIDQGFVDLSTLDTFVLDEADRMLDMGFMPAIKRIVKLLPDDRQSLFFSATLPPPIVELIDDLLVNPVRIDVTPEEKSVELIDQTVQFVSKRDKPKKLKEVLSANDVEQAVVFTRTKRGANTVAEKLSKDGIPAEAIHGNKSQGARTKTLERFRSGRCRVLVATDLAARGLDVDAVSHVINYELPNEPESYVHRIGRTGRAGATGQAIAFCDAPEKDFLRDIEKLIEMRIPVVGEDNVGYAKPEPQGGKQRGGSRGGPRGGGPRGGGAGSGKKPGKRGGARGKRRPPRD